MRALAAATRVPNDPRVRRQAAAKAARRRLRVVTLILAEMAVVAVLAAVGIFGWAWVAIPVGILVAWLVACRLMVRRERVELPVMPEAVQRRSRPPSPPRSSTTSPVSRSRPDAASAPDPDSWDPVPVTLPTYVSKPVASRSVRTIDLDSTGVWTSGRSEADSALVRDSAPAETEPGSDGQRAARVLRERFGSPASRC